MKTSTISTIFVTTFVLLSILRLPLALAQNPVDIHGALSVDGNRIVNQQGNPVSLVGPSLFWSTTGWEGAKYYTPEVVRWVKQDWNATIIRAAMAVEVGGGYLTNPANKTRVRTVVDTAIAEGMYVIIDWHTHHAEDYESQAVSFFQEMATLYGNQPNVIYEIYNEPLGGASWSNSVKPYSETVIAAIRAIDPDNLIIVGSPTWSQDVDVASADPITSSTNIAYALHFYAATHKQFLRDKATTALNNGIALFVTEWGACEANGNGFVDEAETKLWMQFLRDNDIGHCNWSICDKNESASALVPNASTSGGWSANDLTQSGTLVRDIIRNWESSPPQVLTSYDSSETFFNTGEPQTIDLHIFNPNPTTVTTNILTQPSFGTLSGSGTSLTYTPESGFTGTVSFTYEATDGSITSNQATVTINMVMQGPYGGTPLSISGQSPIRLEAENFNTGGSGVAYYDTNSANQGGDNYRPGEGVDIENTSDPLGGGKNLGYFDNGEWLEYTVSIEEGTYNLSARIASDAPNPGDFRIVLGGTPHGGDGTNLTTFDVINTNGWQEWDTITQPNISLAGGTHILRIELLGGSFNLNWIEFHRVTKNFTQFISEYPTLTGTNTQPFVDPDNDGLVSILEQWLNRNPAVAETSQPYIHNPGSSYVYDFTYNSAVTGSTMIYETSINLIDWSPLPINSSWITPSGDLRHVQVPLTLDTHPTSFHRLRVQME